MYRFTERQQANALFIARLFLLHGIARLHAV